MVKNYKKNIDWKNVHLFWVDERCVSPFHDDSNYKLANDNLISKLSLSLGSVHRIKGEINPKLAASCINRYKVIFKKNEIRFDMVLLGMGDDGHVASIFQK